MKIVVLGGSGAQARFAVRELVKGRTFERIVIADLDERGAAAFVRELDSPRLSACQLDVCDEARLRQTIADADVVMNCTGPYYLLGPRVFDGVLSSGKHYIDFCDDIAAHERIFTAENQRKAADRGVTCLIGVGCSPGIAPLMAMDLAARMDQVEEIAMPQLINDREPEGPAVVSHLIENFFGKVPAIVAGERVAEEAFAGEEVVDFGGAHGRAKVSTFGHPEIFTLPRVLPGLKRLTVKLGTFPVANYELMKMLSAVGLASRESIPIRGGQVVPRDVLVSLLMQAPRREQLEPGERPEPESAMIVSVKGRKDGRAMEARYTVYGQMGPATGIPCAIGAEWIAAGRIERRGLLTPEECIAPRPFIEEWLRRVQASHGEHGARVFESATGAL